MNKSKNLFNLINNAFNLITFLGEIWFFSQTGIISLARISLNAHGTSNSTRECETQHQQTALCLLANEIVGCAITEKHDA